MSQRDSGYERKERDLYETPEWVTELIIPHIRSGISHIWEPAAGSGKMAAVLERRGFKIVETDIDRGEDFLKAITLRANAIITNPPYKLATEFIEHAIRLTAEYLGFVAMLLRTDFDHAAGRHFLFRDSDIFSKKVVLTRRIKWFVDSKGQPSFNHAWFIWDREHNGPPTLAYA